MKILILILTISSALFAQDKAPAKTERPLTELEHEKLVRIQLQAQLLQQQFDTEKAKLEKEQAAIVQPACAEVGAPLAECAVDMQSAPFGRIFHQPPAKKEK